MKNSGRKLRVHWNSSGIGILIGKEVSLPIDHKSYIKTIHSTPINLNFLCKYIFCTLFTHIEFSIICLTLIWRQKWCCFAWQHDRQLFFLLFPDLCRQKVESRTWYNSVKLPVWHCLPTIPHDQRPKTCPCLAWDPTKKKSWKFRIRRLEICGEATCSVFMI